MDNTLTFTHYITAFTVSYERHSESNGSGSAWDSFWTTIYIAAAAAPLTAIVGLITAYLLTRQTFAGKNAFEFGTMLSFRHPGHSHRRQLHPGVQRPTDRDHRHRHHPDRQFHLSATCRWRAGRHRQHVAAGQVARRILADPGCELMADIPARDHCRSCARRSWPLWSIVSCAR